MANTLFKEPLKVLIVEDDMEIGFLLQEILRRHGMSVAVASSGKEAWISTQQFQPDLILSDVMLPGMDGFDLCQKLKSSPDLSHIPVIFISSCQEKWVLEKGFVLGAVDFLAKPFNMRTVVDSVRHSLSPFRTH